MPATGAGLRPGPKGPERPPDPTATAAARTGAIPCVIAQESAEVVVADRLWNGAAAKDRT